MKVSEVWKRDAVKREVALNLGFKVLYIWELDIKTRGEDWIEYCQNEFNPKESHSQLYCSSQCLY